MVMAKKQQSTNFKCLILNADSSPLGVITWKRAMILSMKYEDQPKKGIFIIDHYSNEYIHGPNDRRYPMPAVAQLKEYKRRKRIKMPFSKKNVFIRDLMKCSYCQQTFDFNELTYDHVIPRQKWTGKSTPTNWQNIVSCCFPCNQKKGGRTPKEAGMTLSKTPEQPSTHGYILGLSPWSKIPLEWEPYLPQHYKDICNSCNGNS